MLDRSAPVYVAGHTGMVGSALVRLLAARGFRRIVTRTHAELDLVDQRAVRDFLHGERPSHVFVAAARVGGIEANDTLRAQFLFDNLQIAANLVDGAHRAGIDSLTYFASNCIYPRGAAQPIGEDALLTGALEPTNEPYAIAKIAGLKLCESYRRQYGRRYTSVVPASLYGPNDCYEPGRAHVLPALLRRAHDATVRGDAELVVWGSGTPRREFLHVDDLARACLTLVDAGFDGPAIHVGSGGDVSIRELAELVCATVGFRGRLVFDASKPDGVPRKLLESSRIAAFGWRPTTSLAEGLQRTYRDAPFAAGTARTAACPA